MKYKYFLFDWDGSLGATLPIWFEAFHKEFLKYGQKVDDLEIGKYIIGDWEGPRKYGVTDLDKFFSDIEVVTLEKLENVDLNPGVLDVLRMIKENKGKIAVVTTSRKRWVKGALRKNNIKDMLDVFLGKKM